MAIAAFMVGAAKPGPVGSCSPSKRRQDIIPVHRSEGSGDTFVFSQYLTFSTPSWENDIGYGTTIAWLTVAGSLNAEGNPGVLQLVQKTPYSIGYIGVSLHAEIAEAGLGTAALKSYSGEYLLPSPATIAAAAAALTPRTPADERLTLVNAPGANAYPLVKRICCGLDQAG